MLSDYSAKQFRAVILDMDGVITQTTHLHSSAWKQMFDEFLQHYAEHSHLDFEPFNVSTDYYLHVDGVPRMEAIRNFLNARGISLPETAPDGLPGQLSIQALGSRKNELFHQLLELQGLTVIEDTVAQIKYWKSAGLKLAVATSSRNGTTLLSKAGLLPLFDAKVDGVDVVEMHLKGKPAPDIFITAASQLGIAPAQAVVVEDAQLGVEAARAGNFGLVVGLDPDKTRTNALLAHGADIVVQSLKELKLI